jgi:hypothetical protein
MHVMKLRLDSNEKSSCTNEALIFTNSLRTDKIMASLTCHPELTEDNGIIDMSSRTHMLHNSVLHYDKDLSDTR